MAGFLVVVILGSPLSFRDLFLYTINLLAVSCDATLPYITVELESKSTVIV